MNLKSLKASNFLSFRELHYDFTNKAIIIKGDNTTDEGQKSNGSGKSAFGSAINYALIQDPLRGTDLRDVDLIRWGEQLSTIDLSIYCPVRKETLYIHRTIPLKGATTVALEIHKDGCDVKQDVAIATVLDGNKYILNWLGVAKEDLKNYYLINKNNYKSFFRSSNKDKIDIISRFSKSDIIDAVFPIIDNDIEILKNKKDQQDLDFSRVKGVIEFIKESITKEKQIGLDEQYQKQLDAIDFKINSLREETHKVEESIHSLKNESDGLAGVLKNKSELLNSQKTEINCLYLEDFSEVYKELNSAISETDSTITNLNGKLHEFLNKRDKVDQEIRSLNNLLAGKIECPDCGSKFLLNQERTIKSIQEEITEKSKLLNNFIAKIKDLELKITDLNLDKEAFKEEIRKTEEEERVVNSDYRSLQQSIFETENIISDIKQKINNKLIKINTLKDKIEQNSKLIEHQVALKGGLKKDTINSRLPELIKQHDENLKELSHLEKVLNKTIDEITGKTFTKNSLKGFKTFLVRKQLTTIQNTLNSFLKQMNSDLRVELDGYKELASGKVKEEITTNIFRGSLFKLGSLSAGELCRVDIAMILTIQRLINQTNPWGGLDFLQIDEVTEGVDSFGLKLILDSLSFLNTTVLITTHITADGVFNDQITISKRGGISELMA